MDYEKKYNEALEMAKKWYYAPNADKIPTYANRVIEGIFPELKESEDERIRKELIFYLGDMPEDTELRNGVTNRDVLAWLEKQGEQKATWSENDERMFDFCCEYLDDCQIEWLKSLKYRLL